MHKAIITGASGLLGRAVTAEFERELWETLGLAYTRAKGDMMKIDLSEKDVVIDIISNYKPDAIIHCAAERNPDKVEKDYDESKKLNVDCTKYLAEIAAKLKVVFLCISTDYVFDGTQPPYNEKDEPNPLNMYGKTKYEAEKVVSSVCEDHLILRIGVIYGKDEESIGESAISALITAIQSKKPVKVSNYELKYPSLASDVAAICCRLVENKLSRRDDFKGIYHWCGEERFTKFQMCKVIGEVFSVDTDHLIPDDTECKDAPRPKDSQLCCDKLTKQGIGRHTKFAEGVEKSFKKFFT